MDLMISDFETFAKEVNESTLPCFEEDQRTFIKF